MNMTVTYKFNNLELLADYFDNKARDERGGIREGASKKDKEARRERATVLELVAYMLRNTKLGE